MVIANCCVSACGATGANCCPDSAISLFIVGVVSSSKLLVWRSLACQSLHYASMYRYIRIQFGGWDSESNFLHTHTLNLVVGMTQHTHTHHTYQTESNVFTCIMKWLSNSLQFGSDLLCFDHLLMRFWWGKSEAAAQRVSEVCPLYCSSEPVPRLFHLCRQDANNENIALDVATSPPPPSPIPRSLPTLVVCTMVDWRKGTNSYPHTSW